MPILHRKTITETFLERVRATPHRVGFQFKPTYSELGPVGQWKQLSFKEFYQECRLVSFGLMGLGVRPKDKVVILSNTRFEWSLCDMAILGASAVTVPIYAANTATDVLHVTCHSDARFVILEDAQQLQKYIEKNEENPGSLSQIEKFIVLEPSAMVLAARSPDFLKKVLTLQALKELGRREEARDPSRFDRNLSAAQPEDLITICYTSGATGVPKGVMISHDNLMSVLEDCAQVLSPYVKTENEVVLSFLPFSHIFGKLESMAIYTFGWKQVFAENLDQLMSRMTEVRPTLLFAVPRIFEKVYHRIHLHMSTGSPAQRKLLKWAMTVGQRYLNTLILKKTPTLVDTLEYQAAKTLVFNQWKARFGGRIRFAICGGAPLPREIGEFFYMIGIPILEGYGLTETCAPVAVNLPDQIRFGVVGRPLPEVTIRIGEDGEILVKSRKVFSAYYKMEEETKEAFKDGWFHTGDMGYIDSDGFLHITDRKKDLIITSGGKNVAPQKIENISKSQKFMNHLMVYGDGRHYLTALVTLDREQIMHYANENQILFSEYSELIKNPKIISLTQKMIDEINRQLASYEAIKKFVILPHDFTVESGELTPSLKIRRSFINQRYKAALDSMYGDSARVPLDSSDDFR